MKPKKINLQWQGETYTTDATMQFISSIEDVLPVGTLFHYLSNINESNYSKIAAAFAAALRHAGCDVRDEEVYSILFEKEGINIVTMLRTIAQLTFPPKTFADLFPNSDIEKKN